MIVVFVIDTSPSMGKPLGEASSGDSNSSSMSRLDLAKMTVEEVVKKLKKRLHEHNSHLQQLSPKLQESFRNIGQGFVQKDEYLLLSTGPQYQAGTNICGAGGRLLVGFCPEMATGENSQNGMDQQPVASQLNQNQHGIDSFQRELKRLKATDLNEKQLHHNNKSNRPHNKFPDDGGGAMGLNIALSAGLQMLSRYRLKFKATENFGMGRLPSSAILNPTIGGASTHALQPACLIMITDGACLRSPKEEGGGTLKLNFSTQLREFYQEPFRWDQRIFCLGVGGKEHMTSTQYLHPHLRTLCEVTGGSHMMLRNTGSHSLSHFSDLLVNLIAPQLPRNLPLPDPISLLHSGQQPKQNIVKRPNNGIFVNGGPVVILQALEPDMNTGKPAPKHRAGIYYVPISHGETSTEKGDNNNIPVFQPPVWCIPESFFPSKKLDSLPPRPAQPCLLFARFPSRLGSKCFEPSQVMKALARLDQLVLANLKLISPSGNIQQSRFLKRDVYICEWISVEGKRAEAPSNPPNIEYCPVLVAGAGRPTLSDGEGNYLSIGILHVPHKTHSTTTVHSTITLLPPEPHVLLPLLIRAVESEHRALKKSVALNETKELGLGHKLAAAASRTVHLDESWRNEFRAYMFRLPPYYQNALKRSLRGVLPSSAHSLLSTESNEGALASQCFSKICLQKIRQAEQHAKITNERLERQEAELRRRGMPILDNKPARNDPHHQRSTSETPKNTGQTVKFGQYDPRCPVESYLAALRQMPAPWKIPSSSIVNSENTENQNAMDALGDLPGNCLMAYYESRRRWIFGGSGISMRGLHVDGVNNDGSNVQRCSAVKDKSKESLLSFAGVGVSELNATTTAKMGDYRERLLWSRAPVVGYGANDSTGVSATTSQNGAPVWSVDNDAMPVAFFDERTGEFVDSVQNRIRARLFVNFGNPYKDKRADSLIPEEYLSQRPKKGVEEDDAGGPMTPPTSPPHDTFSASEGEGEAVFAKPISRTSPRKASPRNEQNQEPPAKRQRISPEKQSKQPLPPPPVESKADSTAELHRGSPQSRNKPDKPRDEKQPAPPQPPPPPRRRASLGGAPPPPPPSAASPAASPKPPPPSKVPAPPPPSKPPKGPPPRKHPKPPPRPPPSGTPTKRPPPPPNQGSTASPKPPPPAKVPAPPPPSKPAHPIKRPPAVPEANSKTETPDATPAKQVPEAKKPPAVSEAGGLDLQTPDVKPNVNLPPGWMCVWSKSQKRWYFFNRTNNKSVWQWPPP